MATKERIELSKRIIQKKGELRLSYRDLEKKTGISRATIQRFVKNTGVKVSTENLKKLAAALNVDPIWLIGLEDVEDETNLQIIQAESVQQETDKMIESVKKHLCIQDLLFTLDTYNATPEELEEITKYAKFIIANRK